MRTLEHGPHRDAGRRRGAAASPTAATPGVLRSAATTAASGVVTALLAAAARATVPDALGGDLESAVAGAVVGLGCLAGLALTLGSLLLLASAVLHRVGLALHHLDAVAARVTPAALRRVVAVGVGAGIGLGVVAPAGATEVDLGWEITAESASAGRTATEQPEADLLPAAATAPVMPTAVMPTAVTPTAVTPTAVTPTAVTERGTPVSPTPTATSATPAATAGHVVSVGDSLWTIAEKHLPAGSTVGDVAAAWPAWHQANRDLIGPDPDLIRPGQVLVAPATLEETP